MSHSSRESNLAQFREALVQQNTELLLTIKERRAICIRVQEFKEMEGRFSSYDPAREKDVFTLHHEQFKELSLKELLAFSLIMEDQAQAFAPGSYPTWSQSIHLTKKEGHLIEMINPLLLRFRSPEIFNKLDLTNEFNFLKEL